MLAAGVIAAVAAWWSWQTDLARCLGPRERAYVNRMNLFQWSAFGGLIVLFGILPGSARFLLVPLAFVGAHQIRRVVSHVRARLRAAEGDPVERAKRVN
jgi:hypothetical protein